jgi:hypothetical protein
MQITFDTNNAEDIKQVKAFLSLSDDAVAAPVADEPAEAPAKKAAPAAKKAAPAAKKAAAKPEPTPEPEEAEEADEAPEDEDEDLLGGDEPTMADAVELATKLVSGGEAPRVKAALADVGAKRVSELKGDDIATFVNALRD